MNPSVKHAALGIALGSVISLFPEPLIAFSAFAVVCGMAFVAFFLRRKSAMWQRRSVVCIVAAAVVTVAIWLPVKHLDRKVGPMNYEQMPLESLARSLRQDWHVPVRVYDVQSKSLVMSFRTEQSITRREVLEKLARESSLDLRIGYCGTGATFLFGAHPSFTTLRPKQEQQPVADK